MLGAADDGLVGKEAEASSFNKKITYLNCRKRSFAAKLIELYCTRYLHKRQSQRCSQVQISKGSGKKRRKSELIEKKNKKVMLYQIVFYPMVKKILSLLMMALIRKRFLRVKDGTVQLQKVWKLRMLRHSQNQARHVLGELNIGDSSIPATPIRLGGPILAPSPAVYFRGSLLTSPSVPRSVSPYPPKLSLRYFRSIVSSSFQSFDEYLQDVLQRKSKSMAKDPPLTSLVKRIGVKTPTKEKASGGQDSPTRATPLSGAKRIVLKANPQNGPPTVTLHRALSEEVELSKLTQQNTAMNSGYKSSEIIFEDEFRREPRPPSPSNRFAKDNGARRKWADIDQARLETQRQWVELHGRNQSPVLAAVNKLKAVRWSKYVHFIDEYAEADDETHGFPTREPTISKGILRDTGNVLSRKRSSPPLIRDRVSVKRIRYVAKPATAAKGGGAKRSK